MIKVEVDGVDKSEFLAIALLRSINIGSLTKQMRIHSVLRSRHPGKLNTMTIKLLRILFLELKIILCQIPTKLLKKSME